MTRGCRKLLPQLLLSSSFLLTAACSVNAPHSRAAESDPDISAETNTRNITAMLEKPGDALKGRTLSGAPAAPQIRAIERLRAGPPATSGGSTPAPATMGMQSSPVISGGTP